VTDTDQQENSSGNGDQGTAGSPENDVIAPILEGLVSGREIAQRIENLQLQIGEISKHAREAANQYRKVQVRISRQLSQIDWGRLRKALDELPERTERVQGYLTDRGWYLPMEFFALRRIHEIYHRIEEGKDEEIEAFTRDYARKYALPVVREEAPELFPKREEIIRQALEAHENGKCAVSIPALLSQAEGMFFSVLESHYYDEDEREESREELQADRGRVLTALLVDPLFQHGPLHEDYGGNPKEVAQKKDSWFNRNLILHGHSTDYHTEANSLRAIALVALTCRVVRRLEEK